MGESPDIGGFWLAEAVWVTHALGVGRAMAEWLVDGGSATDLHECDLNRFETHQLAPEYIHDRGIQNYVEVYDIVHPLQPMEDPRPMRTSPFYEREQELGAYFLEGGGWERPHWYGVNERLLGRYGGEIPARNAWAARYWHPIVGAEARATRDGVAMYDVTPLKRIAVEGPGALAFLEGLTTNRLDRPVGSVVYSLMLDPRGGIRSDLTIARLGPDRFQIGANGQLDLDLLTRRAPRDGSVAVRDLTSGTCCIGLWGPRARDVLASRDGCRRVQRSLRILPGARAVGRHGARHGTPSVVRRRARLGVVHDRGYGPEAVGHALGGRPGARGDRRGSGRLRLAPPREGLPLVGCRHDDRARSVRGRPRVRRPHGQGRFRGAERARRQERRRRPSDASCRSSSPTRRPS